MEARGLGDGALRDVPAAGAAQKHPLHGGQQSQVTIGLTVR